MAWKTKREGKRTEIGMGNRNGNGNENARVRDGKQRWKGRERERERDGEHYARKQVARRVKSTIRT